MTIGLADRLNFSLGYGAVLALALTATILLSYIAKRYFVDKIYVCAKSHVISNENTTQPHHEPSH